LLQKPRPADLKCLSEFEERLAAARHFPVKYRRALFGILTVTNIQYLRGATIVSG